MSQEEFGCDFAILLDGSIERLEGASQAAETTLSKLFHARSDCPNHPFQAGKCISMIVLFLPAVSMQWSMAAGSKTVVPVDSDVISFPTRKVAVPLGIVRM